MKTKKVLFVEDDMIIGSLITRGLENENFNVCFMNSLNGFRETLKVFHPDILLLDLEVGNRDSSEELSFIRINFPSLPIIIASSHTAGKEIAYCLDGGADYYIKKPYELIELLSLFHKLSPAANESSSECIYFSNYGLNIATHELFYKNQLVHILNPKEFDLLNLFLAQPGQIILRLDILQRVWQNENAGDSLNNYITSLRNYLKEDSTIQIKTIKRRGYCLILPETVSE